MKNVKKMIKKKTDVVIYQTKDGALELVGDFRHETVWATQAQIAEVFGMERSVITKHLQSIFIEGELSQKAVCAKNAHCKFR